MTSTPVPEDTKRLLSVLDATFLDANASQTDVEAFCAKIGDAPVASVCVLPQWVSLARSLLPAQTAVSTVLNFPGGEESTEDVVEEAVLAVKNGATELDVVIPYDALPYDDGFSVKTMFSEIVEACPKITLKAILETGVLKDTKMIRLAAGAAAAGGADFLKTSTGTTEVGATPEAVKTLLEFMKIYPGKMGLKISGGVRDIDTMLAYWTQAEAAMGEQWCHRKRFRVGGSALFDAILAANSGAEEPAKAAVGY